MPLNSPLDILKLLEKSNCKECGQGTCLAFASSVFKGERELADCTRLDGDVAKEQSAGLGTRKPVGQEADEVMEELKARVAETDLAEAARRLGCDFVRDRLRLHVMGRMVEVDRKGELHSDIHQHVWVALPVLGYILQGKGLEPTGEWAPYRELPGGRPGAGLFQKSCEEPIKKVADGYTDLFEDMIRIFSGKPAGQMFDADIALVLRPLPKVPVLICYWKPEDGMESDITLFFDTTAPDNLTLDGVYTLGVGLTRMFQKIAQTHEG